jgi:hypothetical protein
MMRDSRPADFWCSLFPRLFVAHAIICAARLIENRTCETKMKEQNCDSSVLYSTFL